MGCCRWNSSICWARARRAVLGVMEIELIGQDAAIAVRPFEGMDERRRLFAVGRLAHRFGAGLKIAGAIGDEDGGLGSLRPAGRRSSRKVKRSGEPRAPAIPKRNSTRNAAAPPLPSAGNGRSEGMRAYCLARFAHRVTVTSGVDPFPASIYATSSLDPVPPRMDPHETLASYRRAGRRRRRPLGKLVPIQAARSQARQRANRRLRRVEKVIDKPKAETLEKILETDPIQFLEMSLKKYDETIKGYEHILDKHERIQGKLARPEKVSVLPRKAICRLHGMDRRSVAGFQN